MASQRVHYSPRHYTVRNIELNDAAMTSIKLSSLLPVQTYSVSVAAKTGAGVGVFSEIFVNTSSYNVRTYQHWTTAGHGSWVMGNGSWVMKIDFDLRYTYYSTDTLRDAISILIPQPCRPLVGEARPGNIVMSSSVRPYVCVHVTTLRLIR